MKTGYILIDFDVIFPMQLLEFIDSVNFGSNLKKKCIKNLKYVVKQLQGVPKGTDTFQLLIIKNLDDL